MRTVYPASTVISEARFPEDMDVVRGLMLEYRAPLLHVIPLESSDREIAELPGAYSNESGGVILLARVSEGHVAGMVCLRRLAPDTAEMKRLYVRPEHRHTGTGNALALAVIQHARAIGYRSMRLDTLLTMPKAVQLYRLLGFVEREPYGDTSASLALFFELDLLGPTSPLPAPPPEQPVFATERLILRPLADADVPRLQRLLAEKAIARNTLSIPHPYMPEHAARFVQRVNESWGRDGSGAFGITLAHNGDLVGTAGLNVDTQNRKGELGYWIGAPYWGRGYCTEALRPILNFGFETLRLNRIVARVFGSNPASGRVLEKLGFTLEGTLRSNVLKWGVFEDILHYGLDRPIPRTGIGPR